MESSARVVHGDVRHGDNGKDQVANVTEGGKIRSRSSVRGGKVELLVDRNVNLLEELKALSKEDLEKEISEALSFFEMHM